MRNKCEEIVIQWDEKSKYKNLYFHRGRMFALPVTWGRGLWKGESSVWINVSEVCVWNICVCVYIQGPSSASGMLLSREH